MSTIALELADLQILFDTAVGSMDFASGFLDREEVDALRRIAVLLGVDPTDATPENFAKQYPHAFVPPEPLKLSPELQDEYLRGCAHCRLAPRYGSSAPHCAKPSSTSSAWKSSCARRLVSSRSTRPVS